jgi:Uma2 family endonuclease
LITEGKIEVDELIELEDEEWENMGSINHSIVQAKITGLLLNDDRFTPAVELSLDISQIDMSQFGLKAKEELKPDLCLYQGRRELSSPDDILKMTEMPLLVIEVLSPKQTIDDILAKFKAYFTLGIKSCWLVTPAIRAIAIYSQPSNFKTFGMNDTEVIDEIMDIHLPIQKVFGW